MRRLAFICVFVFLVGWLAKIAFAQLDPGYKIYLLQDGVRVGEVYVPPRANTALQYYKEHWVLYSKYQYPGPANLRGLVIQASPSEAPYASLDDFYRRVPWGPKSKYIVVTATESFTKGGITQ
jgi:hypothetical protein